MTTNEPLPCGVCTEPPCMCSELEELLGEAARLELGKSAFMQMDTFDIGTAMALATGQPLLNLFFHPPGTYEEFDGTDQMLIVSFDQFTAARLIHLCLRAYHENWGPRNEL